MPSEMRKDALSIQSPRPLQNVSGTIGAHTTQ